MIGVSWISNADVTESVYDIFLRKDTVRRNQSSYFLIVFVHIR